MLLVLNVGKRRESTNHLSSIQLGFGSSHCQSTDRSDPMGSSSSCYHDSNQITKEELKPGDHIYSWRDAKTYAHHGIYVGDGWVIHYVGGDKNGSLSEAGRVIESSLGSFLLRGGLYAYRYGVTPEVAKTARGGTCTIVRSGPSECVLCRARYLLLRNGFGLYNIFKNNCEDFAIYCMTGLLDPTHLSSGQAASFKSWRNKNFTGDTAFQCLDQTPYIEIPVEVLIAVSSTDGSESGARRQPLAANAGAGIYAWGSYSVTYASQ